MAKVMMCDKCGAVYKKGKTYCLKIFSKHWDGYLKDQIIDVDLCESCFQEIKRQFEKEPDK